MLTPGAGKPNYEKSLGVFENLLAVGVVRTEEG